jgi:hypothetical protein
LTGAFQTLETGTAVSSYDDPGAGPLPELAYGRLQEPAARRHHRADGFRPGDASQRCTGYLSRFQRVR